MHFFVYMLYLSKNDLWINRDFFYILEVSYFCLHWLYQEFIGNGLQHTGSFSWLLMTRAFQGDESGRLNYTQLPFSLASLFFWTFTFTHFRKLFNIHNHSLGKKKKILPLTSLIQCHYTTTFFFFVHVYSCGQMKNSMFLEIPGGHILWRLLSFILSLSS